MIFTNINRIPSLKLPQRCCDEIELRSCLEYILTILDKRNQENREREAREKETKEREAREAKQREAKEIEAKEREIEKKEREVRGEEAIRELGIVSDTSKCSQIFSRL